MSLINNVHLPKNFFMKRGRPKRNRILAEAAATARDHGATLRQIHQWLNGYRPDRHLSDVGQPEKPYYRAARRWSDSGKETLVAFRTKVGECYLLEAAKRAREALEQLEKVRHEDPLQRAYDALMCKIHRRRIDPAFSSGAHSN